MVFFLFIFIFPTLKMSQRNIPQVAQTLSQSLYVSTALNVSRQLIWNQVLGASTRSEIYGFPKYIMQEFGCVFFILTFQLNGVSNGECAMYHVMARTNNNSVTLIAGIYSRQRITMELENNNNILQIYIPKCNLSNTPGAFMFHVEKGAKTAYVGSSLAMHWAHCMLDKWLVLWKSRALSTSHFTENQLWETPVNTLQNSRKPGVNQKEKSYLEQEALLLPEFLFLPYKALDKACPWAGTAADPLSQWKTPREWSSHHLDGHPSLGY